MRAEDHDYVASVVVRRVYESVLAATDSSTAIATNRLLAQARAIHRVLDPEHIEPGIELIVPLSRSASFSIGQPLGSLRSLLNAPADRPGAAIYVLPNGQFRIEYRPVDESLPDGCVKYLIDPYERETILTTAGAMDIDPLPGLVSPFALPYFRDLETALQDYYDFRARESNDSHLTQIWADPNRLVLTNKPEHHMRRSLHEFLSTRLRDADPDVLQEQNVNESEPVDVRIQWNDGSRISLLEVKWLGDSLGPHGEISVQYRDARAREGYTQTRNYVHAQRATLGNHAVRGRMILFDARRRGVSREADGSFSSTDAWAFEMLDVDYSAVAVDEVGVEEPRRFFLQPTV